MFKLRHLIAVFILCTSSFAALAQGQANHWYFGKNAGIVFKNDTAVAVTTGRLTTEEGSATLSDKAGNLLLYTNGVTVWNRDHRVMPNGNSLMGGKSSTQSAIILPKPGSDNIFYVFTTTIQAQPDGLRYTIVDLTKDGGQGDVVSRNLFMIAPATEKLTAVRHSNGHDWWLLAHRWNSNGYLAYLVTAEGVSVKPVMSQVGTVHGGPNRKAIGYLVPSPDGTRLAAALWNDDSNFELLDFNPATGEVSNPILLKGFTEAYGVAFSPDGTKLYGTTNNGKLHKGQVVQFDLQAGSAEAIAASAVVVATSGSPTLGALVLGPDDKMYVARKDNLYLGVISQPNLKGTASSYTDDGFRLGGRKSDLGLPNFAQGIRSYPIPSH